MFGQLLSVEAFGFLLVMTRLTPMVMLIPVLGDQSIPLNVRAAFAFGVSLIIYGLNKAVLPPMPENMFTLVTLMVQELLIGSMLALMARILMSAAHTAGTIIAFQTGLASAQTFDPAQGSQSVIVASFMSLIAITLIVVTDLHHLMIQGFAYSYAKFPVGEVILMEDFAVAVVGYVSDAFALGFQLAAPFIVYAMIFNTGLGLIARMMQGFQVFFVGLPLNLFMGFFLLMVLIGSMMRLFLQEYEQHLLSFMG